jgi:asparagine synthase (glutamine-hydrolysing)
LKSSHERGLSRFVNLSDDRRAAAVIPANAGIQQVSNRDVTRAPKGKMGGPLSSPGALCVGGATFLDPELAAIAGRDGQAAAWIRAFAQFGVEAPTRVRGDFSVAVRDDAGRVLLAVDRFATHPLCYRVEGNTLYFADRADDVAGRSAGLDAQALFDYLYFHVVPAPRTIFSDVYRLREGHYAFFENGSISVAPWWNPVFEETRRDSFEQLRDEFRSLLSESVAAQVHGERVGCFLSGGTDSSTVAGMLGRVTGEPARTFSIGFDAKGFDEMEFARTAARHFDTDHHEYYVTPDDLVQCIPMLAAAYDQPFGNSSVAPAYYCARMAREAGVERILAGDGGDELFGGNSRYAMQRVFSLYDEIPKLIRKSVLEPSLLGWPLPARIPGLKKAVSYVEQARVAMPDRMQSYNLLARIGIGEVLRDEFLATVDVEEPLSQQRAVYGTCNAHSLINRMLAFDWKYTLADNDLPKVVGATSAGGVRVGFPLLDDRLVDFSLRLDPSLKLKGLKLRWFFKEALREFLPEAILAKKKHGFGLPFGVWLTSHAGLQDLAFDSLSSLDRRGFLQPGFVDALRWEHLPQHPSYYGEIVWILVMLEQWFQGNRAPAGYGTL